MPQLDPQHRLPVTVLPGGEFAFHALGELAELGLCGGFGLEHIEYDPLQARQIFRRVVLAHGGALWRPLTSTLGNNVSFTHYDQYRPFANA